MSTRPQDAPVCTEDCELCWHLGFTDEWLKVNDLYDESLPKNDEATLRSSGYCHDWELEKLPTPALVLITSDEWASEKPTPAIVISSQRP